MKNIFLDKEWQKEHLKKVKNRAGVRYSPKLNVDLPIAGIFDGISRTESFYNSIREHYGTLNREFSRVFKNHQDDKDDDIQQLYQNLKDEIFQLSKILEKIKGYNTKKILWDDIGKRAKKANEVLSDLHNKLWEKEQHGNSDIYDLNRAQEELDFFEELSSKTKANLSNSPLLLLTGDAGTGKTHLLCDAIEGKIENRKNPPAILIFGELFKTSEDPFVQIIRQLDLKNINKSQFLRLLNNAGKQSNCRAVLAIDALNETRQRNFWKKNLNKIVGEIKKHPNIALIVSVRTGFEKGVITTKLNQDLINEKHRGFTYREWEAVNKFFEEFELPLPEIPLLMPAFRLPLFLLLFCKAFKERAKQNKQQNSGKKEKQIIKGHEGATYIFESFVDSVSKKIAKQFNISNDAQSNIWDTVIEKIAAKMADKNDDQIPENEVIKIVKNAYPYIDYNKLINTLERNLLLFKVPNVSIAQRGHDRFNFRFPFQKFSDHLIGRYIFKKYEKEFGKTNKNLQTAKKFFSKRRKLGKFLDNSQNRGIIEALSIQCPEHLNGRELIEVAPYLKGSYMAWESFVESLIWRKPTAFSSDRKNTLAYINSEIVRIESGYHDLLNAFLAVAPIPCHPFNADFLYKHLSKLSMAKRDFQWSSTFLHCQRGSNQGVDRMVEWAWMNQDKSHINDESMRLCAVALCWFLSTPVIHLRDRATRALVSLLTNRLSVVLDLLEQFKNTNDPYIVERLYAVAYGCAIRSNGDKDGLRTLSKWVYDEIFKNNNPPVHILIRDYARGIIEVALYKKINISISRKKIEPPYNSNWSQKVPSAELLKEKYYLKGFSRDNVEKRGFVDIWSSVMYHSGCLADFGNYILDTAVGHWSGVLKSHGMRRKRLFNDFKCRLTEQQRKLLEKATNPSATSENEQMNEKEITRTEAMAENYKDFINSLPEKEKRFFDKEIKDFLDERENINAPFKYFDTGLAQRWTFNRVVELGYDPKLHNKFDSMVNTDYRTGKNANKVERIGKKYQWIALHELLARISDNFEFDERSQGDIKQFEGPWQLGKRDIDPSCILTNEKPKDIPLFIGKEVQDQYNVWNKQVSNLTWLKDRKDLPNPRHIIELIDDKGEYWIALGGEIVWQEKTLLEQEKYDMPTRKLRYIVKGYLVHEEDKNDIFIWAKQQKFWGEWMPGAHEYSKAYYLGEYPWAPAFFYDYDNKWTDRTDGAKDKKIPAKILATDTEYETRCTRDNLTGEGIRFKLPTKCIIDGMNLTQKYIDGRFFNDREEIIAFDSSVFDATLPRQVFIRKNKLNNFLKDKGYGIFWTLMGAKTIIYPKSGEPTGLLEINGAYTLNDKNKIIGTKRSCFKSHASGHLKFCRNKFIRQEKQMFARLKMLAHLNLE